MMLQILYSSFATFPLGDATDLAIFETAQRNNAKYEVTGFLARTEQQFFQYIEGPEGAIESIYSAIEKDPRNRDCTLKFRRTGRVRRFNLWQMGYLGAASNLGNLHEGAWFRRASELPEGGVFVKMLAEIAQDENRKLHQTLHYILDHQKRKVRAMPQENPRK